MLIADNIRCLSAIGSDNKGLLECVLVEQYVDDNIRDRILG